MAKAKPSKKIRAVSVHSRAARRATSPSLNLDKSITTLPRPSSPSERLGGADSDLTSRDRIDRKVLDITHRTVAANGISKPSQKKGQPKRGQRTTKQKAKKESGRARGEAKTEILEKKIIGSLEKVKVVKDRRRNWDDINYKVLALEE